MHILLLRQYDLNHIRICILRPKPAPRFHLRSIRADQFVIIANDRRPCSKFLLFMVNIKCHLHRIGTDHMRFFQVMFHIRRLRKRKIPLTIFAKQIRHMHIQTISLKKWFQRLIFFISGDNCRNHANKHNQHEHGLEKDQHCHSFIFLLLKKCIFQVH